MKLDLSKPVLDINGKEIKDGDGALSFAAIFRSILVNDKEDENKSPEDKFKDFKLALKIEPQEVDFTLEELTRIKALVGKLPSTLIVGRVYEFIENK